MLIESGCITVENYVGRMCILWNIMETKFRWGERMYILLSKIFLAFTNYYIRWSPLHAADQAFYRKVKDRIYQIGDDLCSNHLRAQSKYRVKRAKLMDV